jgi:hypothetical protein
MTTSNMTPQLAPDATPAEKAEKKEAFFERYLDPVDRLAEVIYGVLIVMTFTMGFLGLDKNTLPQGETATQAVHRLFLAAFGCAVAWGLIDGVMYILTSLFERADHQRVRRAVHNAPSEDEGVAALNDALGGSFTDSLSDEERDSLYRTLYKRYHDKPLGQISIVRDDVYGAFGVFCLAVVATLPVVLPFLISSDPYVAIRLSNLIAIIMLFLVGYRWAKYTYANPWKIGGILALIGVVIVLIAIPLGG